MLKRLRLKKRQHPRKSYGATAMISVNNQSYDCVIEDISKGGALISFPAASRVRVGKLVDIRIPFSDGNKYVEKMGKVTRSDQKGLAVKFVG